LGRDERRDIGKSECSAGKGDTWTMPENFRENPRAAIVLEARERFDRPVSVLDIGAVNGIIQFGSPRPVTAVNGMA